MSLLPNQISEMQLEIDMLHQENGLKLKQILDLEGVLFATRNILYDIECGACWCHGYVNDEDHYEYCKNARKATEHLWRKS